MAGAAVLGLLLAGCATLRVADRLDRDLAAGDPAGGLAAIEQAKDQYAGPNSLLYYLDRGSLLQRAGEYAASTAELEQAERLIEEFSVTSVSEAAGSMLVNDLTLSYSGEDFERVMVNVLKALNFLYLGDLAGAQVEARKVNTRLLQLGDAYGPDAVYAEDAFARYLSAFAYEAAGELNSAYIDYRKAYEAYRSYEKQFGTPAPWFLARDLLRLSRALGFDDEHQAWRERFGREDPPPALRPKRRSELLLVIYDGRMPAKGTRYTGAQVWDEDRRPHLVKVAFPFFKLHPPAVEAVGVNLADGTTLTAAVAEPLAVIAVKTLEQRIGLISAKAVARATTKYLAARQVQKASGGNTLIGLAADLYSWISERADTRSWRTLPFRFSLLRVALPPGVHTLTLWAAPYEGPELRTFMLQVELEPGEKKTVPVYLPR